MVMNYVLPSFGLYRMWVYNVWIVAFGVLMFVIGLFTYGFLGVRILIERKRIDSSLRAVTSGTAIVNHAIKNDVGKLRLFGAKIKAYAEQTEQEELQEDAEVIISAANHIQQMLKRVNQLTEDLELQRRNTNISELIISSVNALEPMFEGIQTKVNVPRGWYAKCDEAQMREALHNVLINAVEAMDRHGELIVRLTQTKKTFDIEVRDTGNGMNKWQVKKALEPFYTTKSSKKFNFGLGLPYTYQVVRKHRGQFFIHSVEGRGTSVKLSFPKQKLDFHVASQQIEHLDDGKVRGASHDYDMDR